MRTRPGGLVVWMTGLSGAGKTTLAHALHDRLRQRGVAAVVLDGDRLRAGLCRDLGFSAADRHEQNRRAAEVAALMADAGLVVIAALISPYAADRAAARALRPPGGFIEVHLDASLAECEARDAKGLYRRARTGALPGFTGIDAPYEPPAAPELRLPTGRCRVEEAVAAVLAEIDRRIGDSPTAG